MIDKKILIMKFREFAINYNIPVSDEYISFIEKTLNDRGFNNNDFVQAIDTIMNTKESMYGAMPNLAMFVEVRPKRPREPREPTYFRAVENKVEITNEQKDAMLNKLSELGKKLRG